jgi:hypothetical protein
MKSDASGPRYLRIAAVWPSNWERAQETHLAVCRWADMMKDVTLREFNAVETPFRKAVVRPLLDWKPHGLLVRLSSQENMRILRRAFPDLPIVSTLFAPPELTTSCVIADIAEVLALARHHFSGRACGRWPSISADRAARNKTGQPPSVNWCRMAW